MILPVLQGIYKFSKAPVTWLLFFMNIIIFILFIDNQETHKRDFDALMENDTFISSQGSVFAQYILNHKENYNDFMVGLAETGLAGKKNQLAVLGKLSIRQNDFIFNGLNEKYNGDEVEIDYWKKKFSKLMDIQNSDVSYILGYNGLTNYASLMNTLSYQFIHGGFLHLLSNMWFLMIFGTFLEQHIGSLKLMFIYLISGIVAAFSFSAISGSSTIPLVGASGSISGLMGLFLVLHWKKPARCMFWILPIKGYTGFVDLPVWAIMGIWFLSDVAGYLGNITEMGGIAHTAHLGGLFFGIIVGLIYSSFGAKPRLNVFSVTTAGSVN